MGTYVVTGGTHGMGAAAVDRLRSEGHTALTVARSNADIPADLGTADGRAAVVEAVHRATGVVDGVITCAALNAQPDVPTEAIVSVNYFGSVELVDGLRPLLAAAPAPAVVVVGSVAASVRPGPQSVAEACLTGDEEAARAEAGRHDNTGVYAASKLALAWWVRRSAITPEWAGTGIRLNMVSPGWVRTRSTGPVLARADGAERARRAIPLGEPATTEEFASLIGFLLGPDARFFCGANLYWDGGQDAAARPDAWPNLNPNPA